MIILTESEVGEENTFDHTCFCSSWKWFDKVSCVHVPGTSWPSFDNLGEL